MQAGLTVKWHREQTHYFQLEAALKKRRLLRKEARVKINVRHLMGAFVGLIVGLALSGFAFAFEKYKHKILLNRIAQLRRGM